MQPKTLAKRIRKNLLNQKERLEKYLDILEKEDEDYNEEDPDKLLEHINLENNIIDELLSFKKILQPLEIIYSDSPYKKDNDIVDLKLSIDSLSNRVKRKTDKNKERLDTILVKVKADLKDVNKKKFVKKTYDNVNSQIVDING